MLTYTVYIHGKEDGSYWFGTVVCGEDTTFFSNRRLDHLLVEIENLTKQYRGQR